MVNKNLITMAEKMKNEVVTEKKEVKISEVKEEIEQANYPFGFLEIKEAKKAASVINSRIGKDISGLVYTNSTDRKIISESNTAYAILSYLIGDKDEARKIRQGIIDKIGFKKNFFGFKTKLICESTTDSRLDTIANSEFGILEYLLGNRYQAEKIRDSILDKIGCEDGYVMTNNLTLNNNNIEANVKFSILEYLIYGDDHDGTRIKEWADPRIFNRYHMLISDNKNACLSVAIHDYLLGYEDDAKSIGKSLKSEYFDLNKKEFIWDSCEVANWGILNMAEKLRQIYEERK